MTQILVVAGEASGDQHAADVVAALKVARPDLSFFGMGGDHLAARGVELLFHAREVSVMGITEVLPKLPRILHVLRALTIAARERRPACALLVDIPDFNLRLAARLKRLGVPVAYYVSPTVWAWREGRVKTIARVVDRMLCILPFEEAFYRERGVRATYVGNPVLDQVPHPGSKVQFQERLGIPAGKPILALLPGSRPSEIRRLLPTMARAAKALESSDGMRVVIPVAPTIDRTEIQRELQRAGLEPTLVDGRAPEVVGAADVALVASGTAVLEAGLMLRPLVVVYKVSALSYLIGRLLVKVAHIALVNLLVGRRLVPELLQGEMTVGRIVDEVRRVGRGRAAEQVVEGLVSLRERLGPSGASSRAAAEVLGLIEGKDT